MAKKPTKKPPRPVYFDTTVPVIRPCSRCGVWLAAGIAEGIHSEAELNPIDQGQQIQAILLRISLYNISRTGLVELDQSRLQAPRGAIYPEHRCDVRWERKVVGGGVSQKPQHTKPPY